MITPLVREIVEEKIRALFGALGDPGKPMDVMELWISDLVKEAVVLLDLSLSQEDDAKCMASLIQSKASTVHGIIADQIQDVIHELREYKSFS